jgi:hypothetical protein
MCLHKILTLLIDPLGPSSVKLNLKGGVCNGNEDINFELTGFRVSGFVKSHSNCASGSVAHGGEHVELLGAGDALVATTSTQSNGAFVFENVASGSYSVRVGGSVTPIQVIRSNLEIRPEIFISGYSVSGSIVDGKKNPAPGLSVVLYSHNGDVKCPESEDKLKEIAKSDKFGTPVCIQETNAQGKFEFSSTACGQYTLAPSPAYESQFDVSPSHIPVTIDTTSQTLKQPFVLGGLKISGAVKNAKSKALSDVTVTLTSTSSSSVTFSAKTDSDGRYELAKVVAGSYKVEAVKKGFTFPSTVVDVSIQQRSIADIVVSKIDICGKVAIPHPPAGAADGTNRKVALKSSTHGDLHTKTDQSGAFCFALPATETSHSIIVNPVVSDYEKKAGLLLSSFETTLQVDTVPITNVHFAQALLAIRGHVICLAKPCDTRVSVQLTPVSGGETVNTGLALAAVQEGQASFEFPLLVPGKYVVRMDTKEWCWEKDQFEVELVDSDVSDVVFKQRGYFLAVKSTNPVKLENQLQSAGKAAEKVETLEIKNDGSAQFCLTKPGIYTIKPISNDFQFERDSYTFATDSIHGNGPLNLVATKVKIQGFITVPEGLHKTIAHIAVYKNGGSELVFEDKNAELVKSTDESNKLTYSVWASVGEEVRVSVMSKILLYSPSEVSLSVSQLRSGLTMPSIEGRYGMIIEGQVSPAVEGVVISVYDEADDRLVLKDINTDSKGHYTAGPLWDTGSYRVEATAAGFQLKLDESTSTAKKFNFKASKLGSLRVTVIADNQQGEPIVAALLSLSGSGYRQNTATNEKGEVLFSNVFPGDYYLMPLLKEYTFAKDKKPEVVPQHQQPITVTVKEGADTLVLIASRVAFSCFGKISSLNGQAEKGIRVEARSGQLLEQAQTDQNGSFRIRGLIPGNEYTVTVSSESSHIERTSPASHAFTVANKDGDVHNADFLAFRKASSRFEVFGNVHANASLLSYITVQLFEEADTSTPTAPNPEPVRELKLMDGVDFFAFAGLSKNHYSLRLKIDSSLSRAAYTFNADLSTKKISFSPDTPSQLVNLALTAETTNETVEIPVGQFYATILAAIAGIGFYYRKPLTKLVKAQLGKKGKESKKKIPADDEDKFVAALRKQFSPKSK